MPKQVYRQSDMELVNMLNEIRVGKVSEPMVRRLEEIAFDSESAVTS
eukprot:CAMPEP_0114498212 /NCGR_PEP_ID=MMETSP0109-20121206/6754_1 /TAXON_ID=29199 /ORGANISM="Chlorarachnion reptans, Strain CCCM449" /LENGTH=46 /DNA_ID= /DNA_START= /DNA_END= /DNA_ORIENTATION=